jgi:hypothetical protein
MKYSVGLEVGTLVRMPNRDIGTGLNRGEESFY